MNHIALMKRQLWLILIALLALAAACSPAGAVEEDMSLVERLKGTDWDLVELTGETPLAGSKITIAFTEEGLRGTAGCNSYFGNYTLDGITFSIGPVGSTEMWCEDLMDQEQTFLQMLGSAESLTLDDGRLTVQTSEGNLVFRPAEHQSLEGTNWVISGSVQDEGVVSMPSDNEIMAEFKEGQMAGSAGCNRYFVGYEIDGLALTLGPVGSTNMMCDEERNQREAQFLTALEAVAGYVIQRETLTLTDASGNALLFFQASK